MSELVLVVLGAVLCFFGVVSVRAGVLVAGFGAGWLLAEAFHASTGTALLVSACGAGLALAGMFLMAAFVFFVGGACVGAVVGAKVFVLADSSGGDDRTSWVLAAVFVPTVAVLGGLLANRFRVRFLRWGTALAGAALLLSGLGRLLDGDADLLWRPESGGAAVLFALAWVALTLAGHRAQSVRSHDADDDRTART
ncbi:DUF4203 domain-containing protein [Aeromicrobium sp. IC_218]|uniref:DUF4203 domain-containing protein n=1 Tax=Aeromicrobium sp. IC_218 TaxID=2545468 RepID=UPI00103ECCD9|nr:DUF4203 domain-containing protein [Aeromicrobium sp. IC_218]TCI97651.1 DUF4203 domain-containing protein [Aeromicrobium sp. IC_218]